MLSKHDNYCYSTEAIWKTFYHVYYFWTLLFALPQILLPVPLSQHSKWRILLVCTENNVAWPFTCNMFLHGYVHVPCLHVYFTCSMFSHFTCFTWNSNSCKITFLYKIWDLMKTIIFNVSHGNLLHAKWHFIWNLWQRLAVCPSFCL